MANSPTLSAHTEKDEWNNLSDKYSRGLRGHTNVAGAGADSGALQVV